MSEPVSTMLLRMLGSGVVPTERVRPAPADPRSLDFASLLDRARAGEVRSGLSVTVDPDLDISLGPETIELLSQVADSAQAQGFERVLVLDGSNKLVLDVERRTITGRVDVAEGELLSGFDAVVQLPEQDASETSGQSDQTPATISGARLLSLLSVPTRPTSP